METQPYYVGLGKGCDDLLRCNDCKKLVTAAKLNIKGSCPHCGCRRVKEVRNLSSWEWFKVRVGLIRFPRRKEFLQEFGRG